MAKHVNLKPPKLRTVKAETFGKGQFKHTEHRSVRFYEDELPELKTWLVGENYHLILKVKEMKAGIDDSDRSSRKGKAFAEFRVIGVAAKGE